jgi:hypothetical protein
MNRNRYTNVFLADLKGGSCERIYRGNERAKFHCCACSPDGTHYAVGTDTAWDPEGVPPASGRVYLFARK